MASDLNPTPPVQSTGQTASSTDGTSTSTKTEGGVADTGNSVYIEAHPGELASKILFSLDTTTPGIAMPLRDWSAEDMLDFVGRIVSATQEGLLQVTADQVKVNQKKVDEQTAELMKKLKDWAKKCERAQRHGGAANALKWFKRIAVPLAAVMSVGLTVATGGAAAPVMMLTFAMAAQSIAEMAGDEANNQGHSVPSLSLADNVTKGFTKMLVKCGLNREDAEKHAQLMSGGLAVGLAVAGVGAPLLIDGKFMGHLVGGIAREAGTGKQKAEFAAGIGTIVAQVGTAVLMMRMSGGTQAASSSTALVAGNIAQGSLSVANGAVGIANAGLSIATANLQHQADLAEIDRQHTETTVRELNDRREEAQEWLRSSYERMPQLYERWRDIHDDIQKTNEGLIAAGGESDRG